MFRSKLVILTVLLSASSIASASAEVCDGIDNDADGLIDNNDPDLPELCDTAANLNFNQTEHDEVVTITEQSVTVTGGDTILVDHLVMAADEGETFAGTTIPADADVLPPGEYSSTLLHFDSPDSGFVTGSLTAVFPGERVVGVVYTNWADSDGVQRLEEVDATFGNSGLTYGTRNNRGLGSNDSYTIDALDQISVSMTVKGGADHIRVLTCADVDSNGVCDTIDDDSDGDGYSFDPEDCDGLEQRRAGWFEDSTGALTDVQDQLSSTSTAYSFAEDGTLWLCEDDYPLNIVNSYHDAAVIGLFAGTTTIDAGGSQGIKSTGGSMHLGQLTVTNGIAAEGGAVHSRLSDLSLDGVILYNNSATDIGGAVYAVSFGTHSVDIYGGSVFNNTAVDNGGGYYLIGVNVTMESTLIDGNSSGYGGGGVSYISSWPTTSTFSAVDTTFDDNYASHAGGGISITGNATATIDSSEFTDNTAAFYGGGISLVSSTLDLSDITFSNNYASAPSDDISIDLNSSTHSVAGTGLDFETGNNIHSFDASDYYDFGTGTNMVCDYTSGCALVR